MKNSIPSHVTFEYFDLGNYNFPLFAVVNNKLHEIKSLEFHINVNLDENGYVNHSVTHVAETCDAKVELDDNANVYASEADFKSGLRIGKMRNNFCNIYHICKRNDLCNLGFYQDKFSGYVYNETKMLAEELFVKNVRLVKCFKNGASWRDDMCFINGEHTFHVFSQQSEVYEMHPYRKVDENGVETIIYPVVNKMALSNEQEALVDELEALMKKIGDNGIEVLYDNEYGHLMLYKKDSVKECGYNVASDEDRDRGVVVSENVAFSANRTIEIGGYINCDSEFVLND